MADVKMDFYLDKKGEHRWRALSSNGKIVGSSSEGFASKANANNNIKALTEKDQKWEFYADKKGEYRWRATNANGKIVGKSSEGFSSKANATNNAKIMGYAAK
jgi:uncharacterized protein